MQAADFPVLLRRLPLSERFNPPTFAASRRSESKINPAVVETATVQSTKGMRIGFRSA
jgi:hypothetical protein